MKSAVAVAPVRELDAPVHKTIQNSEPASADSPLPGYITRECLARRLGKSVRTLDRLHNAGRGPARIQIGAGSGERSAITLYKLSELERWLDSFAVHPTRSAARRRRSARA